MKTFASCVCVFSIHFICPVEPKFTCNFRCVWIFIVHENIIYDGSSSRLLQLDKHMHTKSFNKWDSTYFFCVCVSVCFRPTERCSSNIVSKNIECAIFLTIEIEKLCCVCVRTKCMIVTHHSCVWVYLNAKGLLEQNTHEFALALIHKSFRENADFLHVSNHFFNISSWLSVLEDKRYTSFSHKRVWKERNLEILEVRPIHLGQIVEIKIMSSGTGSSDFQSHSFSSNCEYYRHGLLN